MCIPSIDDQCKESCEKLLLRLFWMIDAVLRESRLSCPVNESLPWRHVRVCYMRCSLCTMPALHSIGILIDFRDYT